jgi:hypothetical protein
MPSLPYCILPPRVCGPIVVCVQGAAFTNKVINVSTLHTCVFKQIQEPPPSLLTTFQRGTSHFPQVPEHDNYHLSSNLFPQVRFLHLNTRISMHNILNFSHAISLPYLTKTQASKTTSLYRPTSSSLFCDVSSRPPLSSHKSAKRKGNAIHVRMAMPALFEYQPRRRC